VKSSVSAKLMKYLTRLSSIALRPAPPTMFRRASRRGSACYRADFDRTYAATRLYALRIRTASRPTLPAEVQLNPMMGGAEHRRCPSPISEATEGIQPIELRAQYGVCQSQQFRAGVSENITAATRQTVTQIARSPSDASRTPATGGDCQPSSDLGTSNIARHAVPPYELLRLSFAAAEA
jgi:hypothetical protein